MLQITILKGFPLFIVSIFIQAFIRISALEVLQIRSLSQPRLALVSNSRNLVSLAPQNEVRNTQLTGGNPIKTPRETERLNGELEIDYQRDRVTFHPNALRESTFSLPLTPLDVDIVGGLTQISRRLENAQLLKL
jgi:hypothetical protein